MENQKKYAIYYHLMFNSHTYGAKVGGTALHLLCAILARTRETLPLPSVNNSRRCRAWMYLFHVLRRISQVIEERIVRCLCPSLRDGVIKSDWKMVISGNR